MIAESEIESRLKTKLEEYGFKVLKLHTPGHAGVMDRMILRPRYSPGAPMFVELKRPGKKLRALQVGVASDWTQRGVKVLKPVTNLGECEQLCHELITMIMPDYAFALEGTI